MSNIIKKKNEIISIATTGKVSVCKCVVIELGVYPQKLACTPKFKKQGVHVPPILKWSGHAGEFDLGPVPYFRGD